MLMKRTGIALLAGGLLLAACAGNEDDQAERGDSVPANAAIYAAVARELIGPDELPPVVYVLDLPFSRETRAAIAEALGDPDRIAFVPSAEDVWEEDAEGCARVINGGVFLGLDLIQRENGRARVRGGVGVDCLLSVEATFLLERSEEGRWAVVETEDQVEA